MRSIRLVVALSRRCTWNLLALVPLKASLLAVSCAHEPAQKPMANPTGSTPQAQSRAAGPVRIDLHLTEASIHETLRAIARAAHVNIDADPELPGAVTLDVRDTPWDQVLSTVAREHHLRVENMGPVIHVSDASKPAAPAQPFTGKPIGVSFEQTPIREAMKTIADAAGVPIVVDDDVQTLVTLRLRSLPWDLVLDHLVRKYGLRAIREEGRIRISGQ